MQKVDIFILDQYILNTFSIPTKLHFNGDSAIKDAILGLVEKYYGKILKDKLLTEIETYYEVKK